MNPLPASLLLLPLLVLLAFVSPTRAKDIRVVVWDEQQPAQKQAYTNFLGNQIAGHLKTIPGLAVKSVNLNDPGQGVSDEILDQCDVLIWWGHVRQTEIPNAKARQIVERIKSGRLGFIALHSAHWAEPFVEAMRERTRLDFARTIPAGTSVTFITPERFKVPKAEGPLTPRVEWTNRTDGVRSAVVILPNCVFPAYRNDGAPSHTRTLLPSHPIAAGIPATFDLPHTEMYNEPFHVPAPDEVIFEETWDKGERFRSGCVWQLGRGRVFYFRPGHETFAIYTQAVPLKILANAVAWIAPK